jgi:hypothetical protein
LGGEVADAKVDDFSRRFNRFYWPRVVPGCPSSDSGPETGEIRASFRRKDRDRRCFQIDAADI